MDKVKLLKGEIHDKFDLELMDDSWSIKSPITGSFHNSEYWGDIEDYDFGWVTFGLDFHIYPDRIKLFSAGGIDLGVLKKNQTELIVINCTNCDGKPYIKMDGSLWPEKIYPKRPSTNFDFKMMVEDFLYIVEEEIEAAKLEFNERLSAPVEVNNESYVCTGDDDLPF
jgi:hypothetical protein